MTTTIPAALAASCAAAASRAGWLAHLPERVDDVERRWQLSVERSRPFESSAAWVTRARRDDGSPAVLKLIMPHYEAEQEIEGLLFWNGEPTVRVLEADISAGAVLLEECRSDAALIESPSEEQDDVLAQLLRHAWQAAPQPGRFRPLRAMIEHWAAEVTQDIHASPDPIAVERGLAMMAELAADESDAALLVTDAHAGNVLRGERVPWLLIDPKPFVGDRAFDATQHLLNSRDRLETAPDRTIDRFCELLDVDAARVRWWLHARLVADPRDIWDAESFRLAERLHMKA